MSPEFREWRIQFGSGGYLALYRILAGDVIILAVRQGYQGPFCWRGSNDPATVAACQGMR
jgi:hypothetical protein